MADSAAVKPGTPSSAIANWVKQEHKIPMMLAFSISQAPLDFFEGWARLDKYTTQRQVVWKDSSNNLIMGCRATGIGAPQGGVLKDISDDLIISGFVGQTPLNAVEEAIQTLEKVKLDYDINGMIVIGHSLGGGVAWQLAKAYPEIKGVSIFGGAAPSNPQFGTSNTTHYHCIGDIVSSHISGVELIRVDKGYRSFNPGFPHLSPTVLTDDPNAPEAWKYASNDDEDLIFTIWATKPKGWDDITLAAKMSVIPFVNFLALPILFLNTLANPEIAKIAFYNPIPGSSRFYKKPCSASILWEKYWRDEGEKGNKTIAEAVFGKDYYIKDKLQVLYG